MHRETCPLRFLSHSMLNDTQAVVALSGNGHFYNYVMDCMRNQAMEQVVRGGSSTRFRRKRSKQLTWERMVKGMER